MCNESRTPMMCEYPGRVTNVIVFTVRSGSRGPEPSQVYWHTGHTQKLNYLYGLLCYLSVLRADFCAIIIFA